MKTLLLTVLLLTSSPLAFADEPACREESLVHFFSGGKEVTSELIGGDDACDQFGGNLIYTPAQNRFVYVNFNIAGTINLDQVDAAFAKVPPQSPDYHFLANVDFAVVTQEWLKRVYHTNKEAVLNLGGDTLFVSEIVVNEARFGALVEEFYGSARP